MKFIWLSLLSLTVFLPSGCSTNNPVAAGVGLEPTPAHSEYLRTSSGGFMVAKGEGGTSAFCRYILTVALAKPLSAPLYLRTRFENPAQSSEPYVVDSELTPDDGKRTLESPPVTGLQPLRSYKVDVLIYDSPERTKQIGEHIQWVQWKVLTRF
jgi:hypothetical protein